MACSTPGIVPMCATRSMSMPTTPMITRSCPSLTKASRPSLRMSAQTASMSDFSASDRMTTITVTAPFAVNKNAGALRRLRCAGTRFLAGEINSPAPYPLGVIPVCDVHQAAEITAGLQGCQRRWGRGDLLRPLRVPIQLDRFPSWPEQFDQQDRSGEQPPRVDVGPTGAVMDDHHGAVVGSEEVTANARAGNGDRRIIDQDVE